MVVGASAVSMVALQSCAYPWFWVTSGALGGDRDNLLRLGFYRGSLRTHCIIEASLSALITKFCWCFWGMEDVGISKAPGFKALASNLIDKIPGIGLFEDCRSDDYLR